MPDLSGQDLEIYSQKPWRSGRHCGLIARKCSLVEWMKLAIAIDDVARSEGVGHDGEFTGEVDTAIWGSIACSSDEAGGSSHCSARITLDAAPYLARQLSRGQNRGKHCCSSWC